MALTDMSHTGPFLEEFLNFPLWDPVVEPDPVSSPPVIAPHGQESEHVRVGDTSFRSETDTGDAAALQAHGELEGITRSSQPSEGETLVAGPTTSPMSAKELAPAPASSDGLRSVASHPDQLESRPVLARLPGSDEDICATQVSGEPATEGKPHACPNAARVMDPKSGRTSPYKRSGCGSVRSQAESEEESSRASRGDTFLNPSGSKAWEVAPRLPKLGSSKGEPLSHKLGDELLMSRRYTHRS